jgi:hypothetical protein
LGLPSRSKCDNDEQRTPPSSPTLQNPTSHDTLHNFTTNLKYNDKTFSTKLVTRLSRLSTQGGSPQPETSPTIVTKLTSFPLSISKKKKKLGKEKKNGTDWLISQTSFSALGCSFACIKNSCEFDVCRVRGPMFIEI